MREARGLGVRELARRAGVAPSVVTTIEQDKHSPNLKSAQALAKALEVTVDNLLEKEE